MLPRKFYLQRQGSRTSQVEFQMWVLCECIICHRPCLLFSVIAVISVEERRAREVDEQLGPKNSQTPVADFIFGNRVKPMDLKTCVKFLERVKERCGACAVGHS